MKKKDFSKLVKEEIQQIFSLKEAYSVRRDSGEKYYKIVDSSGNTARAGIIHRQAAEEIAAKMNKETSQGYRQGISGQGRGGIYKEINLPERSVNLEMYKTQLDGIVYSFDKNLKFLRAQDKMGKPYSVPGHNVELAKQNLKKRISAGKSTWPKNESKSANIKKNIIKESLTKKDFVAMVKYIKAAPASQRDALTDFAIKISKDDNPRFDETRFRTALGETPSVKIKEAVLNENCSKLIKPLEKTLRDIESWEPLVAKAIEEALAWDQRHEAGGITGKLPSALQRKHNEAYHAVEDLLKFIKLVAKRSGEIK